MHTFACIHYFMKIKSTIKNAKECKMLARYLEQKHRGSGGGSLLHAAMRDGDIDSLQLWFKEYGRVIDSNLWRKSAQWLYNQRVQSRNNYTSARIRTDTHEQLKQYVLDGGFGSVSDAIDALLAGKQ